VARTFSGCSTTVVAATMAVPSFGFEDGSEPMAKSRGPSVRVGPKECPHKSCPGLAKVEAARCRRRPDFSPRPSLSPEAPWTGHIELSIIEVPLKWEFVNRATERHSVLLRRPRGEMLRVSLLWQFLGALFGIKPSGSNAGTCFYCTGNADAVNDRTYYGAGPWIGFVQATRRWSGRFFLRGWFLTGPWAIPYHDEVAGP